MLLIPNKKEFLRIKNKMVDSNANWNKQFDKDKWSVSDNEPAKYPCYCQIAPTINYQYCFYFFYDGGS